MKRIITLLFTFPITLSAFAQSLSSEVISSLGEQTVSGSPSIILSSTCGEAVSTSSIGANLNMHAGFQQGLPPIITYIPNQPGPKTSWQLFPNPNSGAFFIQPSDPMHESRNSPLTFIIIDQLGRQVQRGILDPSGIVQLKGIAAGIYTMQLVSLQQVHTSIPFVVSHNE
jgi:hypothetical protein